MGKAVGVIREEVEWKTSRSYFYWRLRRKLSEFDLRKQIIEAAAVGRGVKVPTPIEATNMIKQWFLESPGMTAYKWENDKTMLSWMSENHGHLQKKLGDYTKDCVVQEVFQVMTAGGETAKIGAQGIVEGISMAMSRMTDEEQAEFRSMLGRT